MGKKKKRDYRGKNKMFQENGGKEEVMRLLGGGGVGRKEGDFTKGGGGSLL